MARPSKFKPEFVTQAEKLANLGATDREIADFFGVEERTLHRWKADHPDFCHALKVGKASADERVEQSLYRRALGYSHDDTHFSSYEGVVTATPYVKHHPPDTTAAIFWLKNRKPAEWRDVREIKAQVDKRAAEMSEEELLAIATGGGSGDPSATGGPH